MAELPWGPAGSYPQTYEALAVPAFFRPFAEDLVDRAALASGERVLDVACGTGVVARAAAARVPELGRLTGLDLTDAMLEVARGAADGTAVEWVAGDAQALPFGDGAFDVVLSQQGLQFVPDPEAAAREMRRVLAPGGRALVACWAQLDRAPLIRAMAGVLTEQLPDLAAMPRIPHAMTSERLRELFTAAGFAEVDLGEHEALTRWASPAAFVRTFREGTPMALVLATRDPAEVERLSVALEARLAQLARADGTLEAPMVTHVVHARR
jgi:ubiquinone/menaquinone biosynthesis C-methylase UbiE